jgi:dephospho-CoA kinase
LLIVGLTGGIATGKTTVADMFRRAGAHIIDADRIAHQVVTPGQPAWDAIVATFGAQVLRSDGAIDRERLGAVVFKDAGLRKKLEDIVHPRVWSRMGEQIEWHRRQSPGGLIILDVPLLIETGRHSALAEVILVYTPQSIQMQRLMHRDGISRQAALERIHAQMPIEEKRLLATTVIDNSGCPTRTEEQALQVFGRLSSTAAESQQ